MNEKQTETKEETGNTENKVVTVFKAIVSAPVAFAIANVISNIAKIIIAFLTNSAFLGYFAFDWISYLILAVLPIGANAIGVWAGLDAVRKWLGTYKVAAVTLIVLFVIDICFGVRNYFVLGDTISDLAILILQDGFSIATAIYLWYYWTEYER